LTATNIQQSSIDISFASVIRAKIYTINATGINFIRIEPIQGVHGLVTKKVTGLNQGSPYLFKIVAIARDVNGNTVSSPEAILKINTTGENTCFLTF